MTLLKKPGFDLFSVVSLIHRKYTLILTLFKRFFNARCAILHKQ
jgi:hypothetical protein